VGIPFGVTIYEATLKDRTVTLRETESCSQVTMKLEEVPLIMNEIIEGHLTWDDVVKKYPLYNNAEADDDK